MMFFGRSDTPVLAVHLLKDRVLSISSQMEILFSCTGASCEGKAQQDLSPAASSEAYRSVYEL